MPVDVDEEKKITEPKEDAQTLQNQRKPLIDPSLAFRMGLVSLARFGALVDFLEWVKS